MFAKVLLCCFIAYVSAGAVVVEPLHAPQPYSFGYDNVDEFGTRNVRQETGDEFNNKVGTYSYVDAFGLARTVNYVADAGGFRATVQTNEPGTKTSSPADALYASSAAEVVPAPVVVKAAPVVAHTVPVGYGAHHVAHPVAPVTYGYGHAPVVVGSKVVV